MRKFVVFIIIFIFLILSFNNVFAVVTDVNVTNIVYGDDLYNEIVGDQKNRQDQFVFLCLFPYLGNTETWTVSLKPIFDQMHGLNSSVYVSSNVIRDNGVIVGTRYGVTLYFSGDVSRVTSSYTSHITNETFNITQVNVGDHITYNIYYYFNDNSFSVSSSTSTAIQFPYVINNYRSDNMLNFINTIYGVDNTGILNVISSYLDSIDTVNNDILDELEIISSSLTNLPSQLPNNTAQINSINNKISDILTDNDTIISQNSDMLEQQEQINENIQETNDKIDEVKDTITDDTIESGADDLPSVNVNDPTENGIDNIFQAIYNAFCTGQAQDIVFPIPFTNKNITLNPYYIRDMLTNNGATWVYTLIQAFWGYLIGRFIVKDISKKITKIKGGNIENIENENIKEDML